jgi:L-rhamnose mutarotase
MQRLYFALDLQEDPALIAEYENWHRPERIWPEVVDSLRARGVAELEILRCGNRLVMIIEARADFASANQAATEAASPRVRAWEDLMWQFQRPLPFAQVGEKWVPMKRLFSLSELPPLHKPPTAEEPKR